MIGEAARADEQSGCVRIDSRIAHLRKVLCRPAKETKPRNQHDG